MTNTNGTKTHQAPMNSLRKTSLVAGVFYVLTFVSIPTLWLYGSVRGPNYILESRPGHSRFAGRYPGNDRGPRRYWHSRRSLPGAQETKQRARTGICRQPGPGSRHHLCWYSEPPVDRDLTAGRCGSRCADHRPGAGCPVLLDVSFRTKLHSGSECRVAGLPVVSVAAGAAGSSRAGILRSSSSCRCLDRHAVRLPGTGVPGVGSLCTPDRAVGVFSGHLPRRQRLQALAHHSRHVTQFDSLLFH